LWLVYRAPDRARRPYLRSLHRPGVGRSSRSSIRPEAVGDGPQSTTTRRPSGVVDEAARSWTLAKSGEIIRRRLVYDYTKYKYPTRKSEQTTLLVARLLHRNRIILTLGSSQKQESRRKP